MHRGCFVWTPTPPRAGGRTPRPGPVRVCVCSLFSAGSGRPASRVLFGAPYLSYGRFLCLLCFLSPHRAQVALYLFVASLRSFFFFFFAVVLALLFVFCLSPRVAPPPPLPSSCLFSPLQIPLFRFFSFPPGSLAPCRLPPSHSCHRFLFFSLFVFFCFLFCPPFVCAVLLFFLGGGAAAPRLLCLFGLRCCVPCCSFLWRVIPGSCAPCGGRAAALSPSPAVPV